jgi:hypothetical protein
VANGFSGAANQMFLPRHAKYLLSTFVMMFSLQACAGEFGGQLGLRMTIVDSCQVDSEAINQHAQVEPRDCNNAGLFVVSQSRADAPTSRRIEASHDNALRTGEPTLVTVYW